MFPLHVLGAVPRTNPSSDKTIQAEKRSAAALFFCYFTQKQNRPAWLPRAYRFHFVLLQNLIQFLPLLVVKVEVLALRHRFGAHHLGNAGPVPTILEKAWKSDTAEVKGRGHFGIQTHFLPLKGLTLNQKNIKHDDCLIYRTHQYSLLHNIYEQ